MKIKVSEATNLQLDWLVAKIEGYRYVQLRNGILYVGKTNNREAAKPGFSPTTNRDQGGLITERELIATKYWRSEDSWIADVKGGFFEQWGQTPLIAAMRCFVSSRLGDEAEIPEELT